MPPKVPKRIARAVLNALKGGVVPRIGLPYITVGRKAEIEALLNDVDVMAEGGAAFRFVTGRYGSGKSFLLQTIRSHVMDRGFVVADADLSPERRLHGTAGQGIATYRELIQNLATKTMPEGGALTLILDRWVAAARARAAAGAASEGIAAEGPLFEARADAEILRTVSALGEVVHGFEFSTLLVRYSRAGAAGDDETKAAVVKWFRGEYATRREAKEALGIGLIITDDNWYDFVKLFALFFKGAGYAGLLILIDELVNLYKIPNSVSRQYNYEKILTMYNDTLQGKARYLGIIMGGTPQAVEDRRRGLFSYEALRSRLSSGRFSTDGRRDLLSPVIALTPLTVEELLILAEKTGAIHAELYGVPMRMTETDIARFLQIEFDREGAETHITPREIIRDFIEALNLLMQYPDLTPEALFKSGDFMEKPFRSGDEPEDDARQFAEFTI